MKTKLEEKEIKVIEDLSDLFNDEVDKAIAIVDEIFRTMEAEGLDPSKRLAEIASQKKWNPEKEYFPDHVFSKEHKFDGAFLESPFIILLLSLQQKVVLYESYLLIFPCMIVGRAMKYPQVQLFVNSAISAAKAVKTAKDIRWSEREEFIYETLKRFID